MNYKKLLGLLALLLSFALVASACGDDDDSGSDTDGGSEEEGDAESEAEGEESGDEGEAMSGGSVTYGIVEPAWIDSFNTQDSEGFEVARLLFDGLTDYGEDLEPVPAVATEWTTEDNIVWTFTLRDDVTFHDGTPVTAQSFVDGWNRVADPEMLSDVAYQGSLAAGIEGWEEVETGEATEISGVEAIDDTTLQVTLVSPYAPLPKVLSHPVFSPVNLAAVEAGGDSYSDSPVGNGPYMMDGVWQHDVAIDLVRFEDYYGEAGLPDAINFGIYDSQETMYLEAQAGNLDISEVPPENITTMEDDFPGRTIDVPVGVINYLGFPQTVAPFENPDIRRAMSLAIDRETITEEIFAGTRFPANGFAPELAPGAISGCEYTEYDPETAKELFDAAGGIPEGKVTISFNTGGGHEDWTQAVANGWLQTLGIEADFVGQEFAPYYDVLQAGEASGPYRAGWGWDSPTAENFLSIYHTDSVDNYASYSSESFDSAIDEFRLAASEEEGFPALATAQEILCEDMPVAPMFFNRQQKVYTERVDNVVYSVFGFTLLEDVEVVG